MQIEAVLEVCDKVENSTNYKGENSGSNESSLKSSLEKEGNNGDYEEFEASFYFYCLIHGLHLKAPFYL